jgi:hypothetical protein
MIILRIKYNHRLSLEHFCCSLQRTKTNIKQIRSKNKVDQNRRNELQDEIHFEYNQI